MTIIKAGWLQRRTTILKNWKREWFVLSSDARLLRMSSPADQYATVNDIFQLHRTREIRIGADQVRHIIEPPNGSTREQLMELVPSEGDIWTLCAESTDDLLAWQTSFDDVRQLYVERMQQQQAQWTNTQIPSGRSNFAYYRRVNDNDYAQQIYQAPDGSSHTIIFVDRGPRYDTRDDMATGVFTGMAFGSLLMWPLFMFPLLWC